MSCRRPSSSALTAAPSARPRHLDQGAQRVVGLGGNSHGSIVRQIRLVGSTVTRRARAPPRRRVARHRSVLGYSRVAETGRCSRTARVSISTRRNGGTVSHYKSNLRDIEFNLFEVLGRDDVLGTGPVRGDGRRHRPGDPGRGRPARPRGPRRVLRGQRPQPAGLRPGDQHRARARVVQEVLPGLDGRRVLAARHPRAELGGTAGPLRRSSGRSPSWCSARTRRSGCTPPARFAGILHHNGNERDKRIAAAHGRARSGAPPWC